MNRQTTLGIRQSIWHHLLVISLFIVIALLGVSYALSQGEIISGDMGIYITISNAIAYPDLFEKSVAYADMGKYGLLPYTLTPSLIRVSIHLFNSYMPGVCLLNFINIFLLLSSFYAFCYTQFKTRMISCLHAFILLLPIDIGWATSLGLNNNLTPRTTFLIFFIWILYFSFRLHKNPKAWPILMFCQGLLIFIHPVSTFATAFGVWCSFIPFIPVTWHPAKKLSWMFLCGVSFLLAASPSYIHILKHGHSWVPYAVWMEAWSSRMIWMTFYQGLGDFFFKFFIRLPIIPAAVILSWWSWRIGSPKDRQAITQILGFTAGTLITLFLYFTYHHLFAAMEKIPPHTQLIRAIKFLIFSALLCISLSLHTLCKNLDKRIYSIILLAVLLSIGTNSRLPDFACQLYAGVLYPLSGNNAQDLEKKDYLELVAFAAQTKPGSIFLGNLDLIPLRNMALRPLGYSFKDMASLLIFNNTELESWNQATRRLSPHQPTSEPVPKPVLFLTSLKNNISRITYKVGQIFNIDELSNVKNQTANFNTLPQPGMDVWLAEAERLKADYLVINKNLYTNKILYSKSDIPSPVWQNNGYLIFAIP